MTKNHSIASPGLLAGLGPPLAYAPFVSGRYDVSPGLSHMSLSAEDPHRRLIQLDREYPLYRANKEACRAQNPEAYMLEAELDPVTARLANQALIDALCAGYPDYFRLEAPGRLACRLSGETLRFDDMQLAPHPVYRQLLDALACQLQEDIAIWQARDGRDWLAALHVCAPNGWAPAEKIGKSFDFVHESVPGMERQRASYGPLLAGLIRKPAYCRFLWDLRTDPALNHHPERVSLPAFNPARPALWVRLERQLLYGLPEANAVLFMIRSYRYPVAGLELAGLKGIDQALSTMPAELLAYKRLDADYDAIRTWLAELIRART